MAIFKSSSTVQLFKTLGARLKKSPSTESLTQPIESEDKDLLEQFGKAMKDTGLLRDVLKVYSLTEKRLEKSPKDTAIHAISDQIQARAREIFGRAHPNANASEYSLYSWKDNHQETQYFMGKTNFIQGGEATIRFGHLIDKQGRISNEEIVVRCLKQKTGDEVEKEIEKNKILYPGTSDKITFPDGRVGYCMEKLSGKDFIKKWDDTYNSVLIYKNEEKEPDLHTMKKDQIVLSNKKIYWIEDGKMTSCELDSILPARRDKFLKVYSQYDDKDVLERKDHSELVRLLKSAAFCRPGKGLDCREFIHSELTFQQRCQVARDVFEQLNKLHEAGYCHGDVNPTNIKIEIDNDGNAHAKLFDLGQAIYLGRETFHPLEQTLGMVEFVPPEAAGENMRYGKASDMYAMAGVMGMLFSENPNDFIEDRIKVGDDLQRKGKNNPRIQTRSSFKK